MDIIIAQTRFSYPSYTDYRALVGLAGLDTCFIDQIDFTRENTVYIVSPLNGEYRPHRDNWRIHPHNCKVIWWSLERPGHVGGLAPFVNGTRKLLDDHYFDNVWMSDRWLCEQVNDSRCKFVILGSHEGLGKPCHGDIDYDVVHMSYPVPRRTQVLRALDGYKLRISPNSWGTDRERKLRHSRFMLNIHQDDWPVIEPLRFALCAAYGLPMITETIQDAYPYTRQGGEHYIVQAEHQALAQKVRDCVKADYGPYRAMGIRMHEAFTTEYEFGRQVRKAAVELGDTPLDPVIR